ncbi:MAG: hypothetical protein QF786_00005 [Vicinamibacterales bacterium]|nr:hypothetical protein [Vicinamibacterales bacterium]
MKWKVFDIRGNESEADTVTFDTEREAKAYAEAHEYHDYGPVEVESEPRKWQAFDTRGIGRRSVTFETMDEAREYAETHDHYDYDLEPQVSESARLSKAADEAWNVLFNLEDRIWSQFAPAFPVQRFVGRVAQRVRDHGAQAAQGIASAVLTDYTDDHPDVMQKISREDKGQLSDAIVDYAEAFKASTDYAEAEEIPTAFDEYQLPGGRQYRELLIMRPPRRARPGPDGGLPAGYSIKEWHGPSNFGLIGPDNSLIAAHYDSREDILRDLDNILETRAEVSPDTFTDSHWDEKDVLVHIRFNEREGPNGEKILFIEEIQSDWHQRGRKGRTDEINRRIELGADEAEATKAVPADFGYRKGPDNRIREAKVAVLSDNQGYYEVSTVGGEFISNIMRSELNIPLVGAELDAAIDLKSVERINDALERADESFSDTPRSTVKLLERAKLRLAELKRKSQRAVGIGSLLNGARQPNTADLLPPYDEGDVLAFEDVERAWRLLTTKRAYGNEATEEERQDAAIEEATRRLRDNEDNRTGRRQGVPDAPFKTTWTELAIKRMLRYAADGGYDVVAWTTGEQQVERYESELRAKVDRIKWEKTEKGVHLVGEKRNRPPLPKMFTAEIYNTVDLVTVRRREGHWTTQITTGEPDSRRFWYNVRNDQADPYTGDYASGPFDTEREALRNRRETGGSTPSGVWTVNIDGVGSGRYASQADAAAARDEKAREWLKQPDRYDKVVDTSYKETALSDAIGKAMSRQILEDSSQSGTIEGDNIKIDDAGMAGYYDNILVKTVEKYTKPWKGKVGTTLIGHATDRGRYVLQEAQHPAEGSFGIEVFDVATGETRGPFDNEADAEAWIAEHAEAERARIQRIAGEGGPSWGVVDAMGEYMAGPWQTEARATAEVDKLNKGVEVHALTLPADMKRSVIYASQPIAGKVTKADTIESMFERSQAEASARIKKRGTLSSSTAGMGLNPADMADLVIIGAAKIARGTVKFSTWSVEMVKEFGEVVRRHLVGIYSKAASKARSMGAKAKADADLKRPSQIIKALSVAFDDLPVRTGRFRQQALGVYKQQEEVIRLRTANDLDTFAHEFGHHVDLAVLGIPSKKQPWTDELMDMGMETSRRSYSKKKIRMEGAAEFMRRWLTDPKAAKARAPKYTEAFTRALKGHPVEEAIRKAQRAIIQYYAQDLVGRARMRINFEGRRPMSETIAERFETLMINRLAPIRRAVEGMGHGEAPESMLDDGFLLAEAAQHAASKADEFLASGVRLLDNTVLSEGVEEILNKMEGEELRKFSYFLVARHVPEVLRLGKNPGMTRAEAEAIIKEYGTPEFEEKAKKINTYSDALLTYAESEGVVAGKAAVAMRLAYKMYVPLKRVKDEIEGEITGGASAGRLANQSSPIKVRVGSGAEIINPIESLIRDTHAMVTTIESNRSVQAMARQAAKFKGSGRWLEPISEPQVAAMINLSQIATQIKAKLEKEGHPVPDNLDFDEVVKFSTPVRFMFGDKGIVSYLKDGERHWLQVNDRALYEAINQVGIHVPELLITLLANPTTLLRISATMTLEFASRNVPRDTWEAYVNSQYGFKLGYDSLWGIFQIAGHTEWQKSFMNYLGGGATLQSQDRDMVQKRMRSMRLNPGPKHFYDVAYSGIDMLRGFQEALENGTRIGEYRRAVLALGDTVEGRLRAGWSAAEVSINFSRGGGWAKEWNRYSAFFNPMVQGNVRMYEVFKRDPVGATRRAVGSITLLSMLLFWLNYDDPDYWQKTEEQRNSYWWFPHLSFENGRLVRKKNHKWQRLPKPWTLGHVFGNVPEAAMHYILTRDPKAFDTVLPDKDSTWQALFSMGPTAVVPLAEAMANYSYFRQRPIYSPWDEGLEPELVRNRWTSEFAVATAPYTRIPAAILDHLIYGYTAGMGRYATDTIGALIPDTGPAKPARGWEDLPGIRGFTTPGSVAMNAQSISDFYELRERFNSVTRSLDTYRASNAAKADAYEEKHRELLDQRGVIRFTERQIGFIRNRIQAIYEDETMDGVEKRKAYDSEVELLIDQARRGLGLEPIYEGQDDQAETG